MPIPSPSTPLFIGDELALDFINSAYGVGDARRDHFDSGEGVLAWLEAAGLAHRPLDASAMARLWKAATALRATAHDLVASRKRHEPGDTHELNRLLAVGSAWQELVWEADTSPVLVRRERADTPEALLLPVAESLATMLASVDFELVRQCEAHDCTLWFHDRTKAHHRRWCSQATCGNRMKVAAFRARKRG